MKWFPVNPQLTDKGTFALFTADNKELKPVPLKDESRNFEQLEVSQETYSLSIASKLGVVGVGDTSAAYGSLTLVYQAMMYAEALERSEPEDGLVMGTRWGAGLRLAIVVQGVEANLNLNVSMVAAEAQLNRVKADYKLNVYGITSPDILKLAPPPGTFDFNSYKRILDATEAVKEYMSQNTKSLTPVPFQVFLRLEPTDDPFAGAHAVVFAMRQIALRKSLKEAHAASVEKGFSRDILDATYRHFLAKPDTGPSEEESQRAGRWLLAQTS